MSPNTIRNALKKCVFRLFKVIGVFRLTRLLTRKQLLILCYHGFELADEVGFRPELFMRVDVFAKRLETIRRYGCTVVPLDAAIRGLREGTLPDHSVCITIDDGFYSLLACAAPVLQRHSFPATLYVTTYYVSKRAPVFRLVIQYMFWKTTLQSLDVSDQTWGLPGTLDLNDPEIKKQVTWKIVEFGETRCDEPARREISRALGDRLDVDYQAIEETRMLSLLTAGEIKQLAGAGIDVQMHTHRHRLPADDEAAVRREVTENARFLEGILGHAPRHLCYPSGMWHCRQWPWLADLGVQSATTCDPGFNRAQTPPLGLYRVLDDSTVPHIVFEAELCGFSELVRMITGRRKKRDQERKAVPRTVSVGGTV